MLARRTEPGAARKTRITIDGAPVVAASDDSVAAAVLAAGHITTRHAPVSGAARAPYCMMGVCFECLMTIDGQPNRQACMVRVADGMAIETGAGRARLTHDH